MLLLLPPFPLYLFDYFLDGEVHFPFPLLLPSNFPIDVKICVSPPRRYAVVDRRSN